MMPQTRHFVVACAAAFSTVIGLAGHDMPEQAEKPVVLAPEYACSGVLDGKPYVLSLELTAFGDGFELDWVTQGQKLFKGYAVRNGDHLAAVSVDQRTTNLILVSYRIEPGTLNGRWMGGDGEIHTELCLVGKPA